MLYSYCTNSVFSEKKNNIDNKVVKESQHSEKTYSCFWDFGYTAIMSLVTFEK